MFQVVRSFFYWLFVKTGFFYLLFPILHKLGPKLASAGDKSHCSKVVDDEGAAFNMTMYEGKTFPPAPVAKLASVKDIPIRPSDTIIIGYPKTGCHWLYEILYMMRTNSLSISKYGKELGGMIDLIPEIILDAVPSPRILNSHLLYDELPRGIKTNKTKIIVTMREAKDTVVSFFNHHKTLFNVYGYDGKFENYYKLFMAGKLDYGDFFEYYHDWAKVMASNPVNEMFLLKFEDLKKDPVSMIKRLAIFLDTEMTHERAVGIAEASSFNNMKKARTGDPVASKLLRKGVVGDWKNWLQDGQSVEMDKKWKKVEVEFEPILDRQNRIVSS